MYRARAGEADRVEEALRKMVAPTRAEPGNLDYQVFRDPADPSRFVLFERYADAAAFDAHRAAPHFATWLTGVVLPALDDRVRLDLVPLGDLPHHPRSRMVKPYRSPPGMSNGVENKRSRT